MSEDAGTQQGGQTGGQTATTDVGAAGAGATGSGTGGSSSDGPAIANTQIKTDKNKTAEQYMKEAEDKYIVPELIRNKFPDLVKLIYETESMNSEEREYWLQIMPIMTEDQIVKFRDILVNEKEQLSKLDQEYEQEMSRINNKRVVEISEADVKKKQQELHADEQSSESEEQSKEEDLLKQLDNL